MSESNQPKANEKLPAAAAKADEPMREVLAKLMAGASQLSDSDKQIGLKIRDLGLAAKDPFQIGQGAVQVAIATTVQNYERATGKQLDLSAAQRAEVTKFAGSPSAAKNDTISPPKNDADPSVGQQTPPDPMRDVLTKLVASVNQLPASAKDVGTRIHDLSREAQVPVRFNQKSVQHEVAYTAQDFEKATGKQLDLAQAQRTEVTKLAGSAPGLENERMMALLHDTSQIADTVLVGHIRRNAVEIGQKANQNGSDTQSRVEQLENRVRLATRSTETVNEARADGSPKPEQSGLNTSGGSAAGNGARTDQRSQNDPDSRSLRSNLNSQEPMGRQSAVLRGGILDTLTAALRGNGNADNAPWDPKATPFKDRLRDFQTRADAQEQDRVIGRVENSARNAVEALDGFRNTEGAAVMNRIQSAARAEPGGMATVLSEMREGGRFSDLRQAFNTALSDDKGFAQAYDKAATTLARYGEGREKIEQIIAKRPDAANLTAKMERLDSQIGERASNTPSRNEGKNMLDDISKMIAEVIQNAAEKVRAMFSRAPAANAGPAPAA